MAAAGFAIQAAGAVANFSAQQSATDAYNQQVLVNARDASLAAQFKYEDEGRRMIYDARKTQQEGYGAVMKGRQALGTAIASAGSAGFDASSLSVGSILANEAQKTAQNMSNLQTEFDDLKDSYRSRTRSYEAEAQGRINSMPMKAGPSPLGLAINIAGAGLGAYRSTL
jgi:hypothetical protein